VLALCAASAAGQERLISGPGSTLTENKCVICHELQHIRRAQLSRGEWADNLKNMRERGTPMSDAEQQVILEYLSAYYNREKPAPAPGPDTLAGGDATGRLLGEKGCIGCHAVDRRIVGPSFKEVAARYSAASANQLARKIRQGGAGAWGGVPMPPNPGVSDDEAKTLVEWVLSLK
jgi:cytochrome c551/c552